MERIDVGVISSSNPLINGIGNSPLDGGSEEGAFMPLATPRGSLPSSYKRIPLPLSITHSSL